jgi:hypothetical protein
MFFQGEGEDLPYPDVLFGANTCRRLLSTSSLF